MPLPTSKPLTDCHFHVFQAGVAVPGARYVPAYAATLQAWQDAASACGVVRGVLVQPSFLGTDNGLLVAQLQARPDALRGVAVVAPTASAGALHALHRAGVRGIRLNLAGRAADLAPWRRASAIWDALLELGWHVELHTDQGALPVTLASLPAALPLVVDHMGKPAAVRAADASIHALVQRSRQAQVYVKLSGAYRLNGLDPGALARLWLDAIGPARLLWGSDWPCTNHEQEADYPALLSALHAWVGSVAAERVLTDNAQALYWA